MIDVNGLFTSKMIIILRKKFYLLLAQTLVDLLDLVNQDHLLRLVILLVPCFRYHLVILEFLPQVHQQNLSYLINHHFQVDQLAQSHPRKNKVIILY